MKPIGYLHSFFIVPNQSIDYTEFLQLGNVLYNPTEPDNVLAQPRLAEGQHPLGSEVNQIVHFAVGHESSAPSVLEISTFKPTSEFLNAVKADADVNDVLLHSQERRVFLITGVAVTTGFISSSPGIDADEEASDAGIRNQTSPSKIIDSGEKNIISGKSHDQHGPVMYKVQKL